MSGDTSKSVTWATIFIAIGGWFTTAVTNWEKTPWGKPPVIAPSQPSPAKPEPPTVLKPKPPDPPIKDPSYFVHGRMEDTKGLPMKGVAVTVTELQDNGTSKELSSHRSDDTGSVSFNIPLDGKKIRIVSRLEGYRSQEVILQSQALTLPTTLSKLGRP